MPPTVSWSLVQKTSTQFDDTGFFTQSKHVSGNIKGNPWAGIRKSLKILVELRGIEPRTS